MIGNLIIGGGSGTTIADPLGVGDGGTGTTTQFTQGSVVFAGASGVYSQDNANFFWDDTNNALGIGTNTPDYTIDVAAEGGVVWVGRDLVSGGFTQLNGALSGVTDPVTVTVDSTTGFPSRGIILIDSEFLTYTSKTATEFVTATRARFGTTKVSHLDNATVTPMSLVIGRDQTTSQSVLIGPGRIYANANGSVFELPSGTAQATAKIGSRFTIGDTFGVVYGNGTINSFLGIGGSNGYVGTASNHALCFRTNNTERIFINTSGLLQFAGQTSSFPALKRSSTELQARLADDSTFAPFQCNGLTINAATGNVSYGVYTPTRSAEANLDANVTPTEAQYLRVANTVTVSGRFTADPTTTTTATSFEFTLPVASNIGAAEDCAGVAFCGTIAGQGAAITGSVANNTAVFSWIAGDVTSQTWSYTYTYQVI